MTFEGWSAVMWFKASDPPGEGRAVTSWTDRAGASLPLTMPADAWTDQRPKSWMYAVCPVCGTFNREVVFEVGTPTRWTDCAHSEEDWRLWHLSAAPDLRTVREIAKRHLP